MALHHGYMETELGASGEVIAPVHHDAWDDYQPPKHFSVLS